ncbi:MAG TPA: hypothetical protein VGM56_07070 [Byssovorax sp.]|jgi:hypothetical protein
MRRAALFAFLVLTACPPEATPESRHPHEDFGEPTSGDPPPPPKRPVDPADLKPEVTKELGHKGGMIVLWPRVSPGAEPARAHAAAARVQQRLQMLARRAGGARAVEVRPEPEVTCPTFGCVATIVSAYVVVKGDKCGVLAYAAGIDKAPAHLLPWSGKFNLKGDTFPFNGSPEALVGPGELLPCDQFLEGTANEEATIARTLVGLLPNH